MTPATRHFPLSRDLKNTLLCAVQTLSRPIGLDEKVIAYKGKHGAADKRRMSGQVHIGRELHTFIGTD